MINIKKGNTDLSIISEIISKINEEPYYSYNSPMLDKATSHIKEMCPELKLSEFMPHYFYIQNNIENPIIIYEATIDKINEYRNKLSMFIGNYGNYSIIGYYPTEFRDRIYIIDHWHSYIDFIRELANYYKFCFKSNNNNYSMINAITNTIIENLVILLELKVSFDFDNLFIYKYKYIDKIKSFKEKFISSIDDKLKLFNFINEFNEEFRNKILY